MPPETETRRLFGQLSTTSVQPVDANACAFKPKYCALVLALLVLVASVSQAAELELTLSPASPEARTIQNGVASLEVLGAFRFRGVAGVSLVHGVTIDLQGTGNWAAGLVPASGIQAFLDDGDGELQASDQLIWYGDAPGAQVDCDFAFPLTLSSGGVLDVWLAMYRDAGAGSLLGTTWRAEIADASDVQSSGNVQIGNPVPVTSTLTVADFHVSAVTPLVGRFADLTIHGFGFELPVEVTVGGHLCYGLPVINAAKTEITGLRVSGFPPDNHEYRDQEIRISSGLVQDMVLPFTYTQQKGGDVNGDNSAIGACSASAMVVSNGAHLGVLAILAAVMLRCCANMLAQVGRRVSTSLVWRRGRPAFPIDTPRLHRHQRLTQSPLRL